MPLNHSFCPRCTLPVYDGRVCRKCHGKSALDQLIVCMRYEEGAVREAIHTFKYNGVFDISSLLGKIMREKLRRSRVVYDVVVPGPLHKQRLRQRGFNQATLLVQSMSLQPMRGLVRKQYTVPQADLERTARLMNLKDAFEWRGGEIIGQTILLVDDVSTTGATLQACAHALKRAGVREVIGFVLAHG